MNGESFVILANAEWDWESRINCHHIAMRLATTNDVLFVDTIGGRTPAAREFAKVLRRLRRIATGVRSVQKKLRVLAPLVIPIYGNETIRRINTAILARQIRRALPTNAEPILWVFLPSHVGLIRMLNEKLVIYHCVDEHAANPDVPASQVTEQERWLLKSADVVLTTSSTLFESKRPYNPHTFYLPNVADSTFFARASSGEPDDLRGIRRPLAGFIGNITAYKLDFDLIRSAAEQNPGCSFVLIGPIGRGDPSTDVRVLTSLTNVHLLGPRPYEELPSYVNAFDVCLIPFRINDSTRGTLPMKFFEYLAPGKPIIATDLPALSEFREYFYCIHDADEFKVAMQKAAHEDATLRARRKKIAQRYSWDERMLEIERIVRDALTARSSEQKRGN
jgi:glycosyltransferase involved in cell wall biosynthesis